MPHQSNFFEQCARHDACEGFMVHAFMLCCCHVHMCQDIDEFDLISHLCASMHLVLYTVELFMLYRELLVEAVCIIALLFPGIKELLLKP